MSKKRAGFFETIFGGIAGEAIGGTVVGLVSSGIGAVVGALIGGPAGAATGAILMGIGGAVMGGTYGGIAGVLMTRDKYKKPHHLPEQERVQALEQGIYMGQLMAAQEQKTNYVAMVEQQRLLAAKPASQQLQ